MNVHGSFPVFQNRNLYAETDNIPRYSLNTNTPHLYIVFYQFSSLQQEKPCPSVFMRISGPWIVKYDFYVGKWRSLWGWRHMKKILDVSKLKNKTKPWHLVVINIYNRSTMQCSLGLLSTLGVLYVRIFLGKWAHTRTKQC